MHIAVIRKWLTQEATISEVYVSDELLCYGLEDAIREIEGQPVESWKVAGKTAIPCGTYAVEIDYSVRFKRDMPHILDVPGFEGIRIHAGNTAEDTEGCLVVGTTRGVDHVGNSRLALVLLTGKVRAALGDGDDVTITFCKG